MGADYTSIGDGIMFFPFMAIVSVPFFTSILIISLRGKTAALPTSRRKYYKNMFITTAILVGIFFPAVVTYEWLRASDLYSISYHLIGYFGSIAMLFMTLVAASRDKILKPVDALAPPVVAVAYLILVTITFQLSIPGSSLVIGFGYAMIQVVMPLISSSSMKKFDATYEPAPASAAVAENPAQPVTIATAAPITASTETAEEAQPASAPTPTPAPTPTVSPGNTIENPTKTEAVSVATPTPQAADENTPNGV